MDSFPYDRDLLKEFRSIENDRLYQTFPANIYVLKVNNRNTRKRCEICSKLTIKTPENVIDVVLLFLLLTWNMFRTFFLVFLLLNLSK